MASPAPCWRRFLESSSRRMTSVSLSSSCASGPRSEVPVGTRIVGAVCATWEDAECLVLLTDGALRICRINGAFRGSAQRFSGCLPPARLRGQTGAGCCGGGLQVSALSM
jgi:hypothetical protein